MSLKSAFVSLVLLSAGVFAFRAPEPSFPRPRARNSTQPAEHWLPETDVASCGMGILVKKGDTCDSLAKFYDITVDDIRKYNPYLNDDCSNLWTEIYVCIQASP